MLQVDDQPKLRQYQMRIVDAIAGNNTIVLLPTGAGKTPIAAVAIDQALKRLPCTKAVLFVPTIALVSQQALVLHNWISQELMVGQYHGEISFPSQFDVLVTTPKAFETAQKNGRSSCIWSEYSVVVFDEVHHAIKDHPYRSLAKRLLHSGCTPRIIGLTASLTYAVGADKVRAASQKLCTELQISRIEVASDTELRQGGYNGAPAGAIAEVCGAKRKMEDEARTTDIHLDASKQAAARGVIPLCDRKPHLMHSSFFRRIANKTATRVSKGLVECIQAVESDIQCQINTGGTFTSPMTKASLATWGVYAHNQHKSTGLALYSALESWYEACRILVTSWEEGEDLAVMFLRMMKIELLHESDYMNLYSAKTSSIIMRFFAGLPASYERFDRLLGVLQEKSCPPYSDSVGGATMTNDTVVGSVFRGIVFVKQRVTTHILQHYLLNSSAAKGSGTGPNGRSSNSIVPTILYSTSADATPSLKRTSAQCRAAMEDFRSGACNLLISTSVAEEGVDVPEANCVIYLDPIDTSVSYVQGRGRARQKDSSFVMMTERPDRPASVLAQMELEQHAIASAFQPESTGKASEAIKRAQQSRELGAKVILSTHVNKSFQTQGQCEIAAVMAINSYCQKTKSLCDEQYTSSTRAGVFECSLSYKSALRSISAKGSGETKKHAKQRSANELIKQLLNATTAYNK